MKQSQSTCTWTTLSELVEEVKVELSNLNYSFGGEWVAWLGEIIDPVNPVEVWLEVGVY